MVRRETKRKAANRENCPAADSRSAPAFGAAADSDDRLSLTEFHRAPSYAAMFGPTAGLRRGGHG